MFERRDPAQLLVPFGAQAPKRDRMVTSHDRILSLMNFEYEAQREKLTSRFIGDPKTKISRLKGKGLKQSYFERGGLRTTSLNAGPNMRGFGRPTTSFRRYSGRK